MTVHFIGAGPGAADLLTLRAASLLAQSGTCLYPGSYLDDAVLSHCPANARLVDTQNLDLDQLVEHMRAADARGEDVARLCSGDPSLYSTVAEQSARLTALGINWDVTPGVPAYAAAAAVLGRELTLPRVTQSVVLTRAQRRSTPMPDREQLANFAATGATLVLHLAVTFIDEIAETLTPHYGAECPAAVVYRASQPRQRVVLGVLGDIATKVSQEGFKAAAIILVGPALRENVPTQSYLYDPARARSALQVPDEL